MSKHYTLTSKRPAIFAPGIASRLFQHLLNKVVWQRAPDFIVGREAVHGAYLLRWYLTPWRRLQTRLRERAEAQPSWWNRTIANVAGLLPNLYLHRFRRDDDDRALHDHPSWAVSFILRGQYIEHTIAPGGIHHRRLHLAGSLRFLTTRHAHRIELLHSEFGGKSDCWTLFLFGPSLREWGFHCPDRGWVHWKVFTAAGKPGEIGPGCDA